MLLSFSYSVFSTNYNFPEVIDFNAEKPNALDVPVQKRYLYPIGFSKNEQLFAFVDVFPETDAAGLLFVSIVICNLVNDSQKVFVISEEFEPDNGLFKKVWQKHTHTFDSLLTKFDIIQDSCNLHSFPLKTKKDIIDIQSYTVISDENTGFKAVDTLIITATSKLLGEKEFVHLTNLSALATSVKGCFISLSGKRAAVLSIDTYRGWEGIPLVFQFRINGLHLKSGYKKEF